MSKRIMAHRRERGRYQRNPPPAPRAGETRPGRLGLHRRGKTRGNPGHRGAVTSGTLGRWQRQGLQKPLPLPQTLPLPPKHRGGAAGEFVQVSAAVVAHNEAQGSREAKWAITESALARLTGCFRPAVRTFFAERAEAIEAHNQKHHLVPGLNAARGKKGPTNRTGGKMAGGSGREREGGRP